MSGTVPPEPWAGNYILKSLIFQTRLPLPYQIISISYSLVCSMHSKYLLLELTYSAKGAPGQDRYTTSLLVSHREKVYS